MGFKIQRAQGGTQIWQPGDYAIRGPQGSPGNPLLVDLQWAYKLEEASGSRADSSDNGNTLTDNNTVTQVVGIVGNAAQFTQANSEFLNVANNATIVTPSDGFTVACWVKFDTFTFNASTMYIVNKGRRAANFGWSLSLNENQIAAGQHSMRFSYQDDPASDDVRSTTQIASTGVWYFVVAWHDGTRGHIQINNGSIDSAAGASGLSNSTEDLVLSSLGTPYLRGHDGPIDACHGWGRVLTADERTTLYNGGAGLEHPFDA